MTQTIQIKRTTVANHVPTSLAVGELAFNIADDPIKAWIGTAAGVKRLFAGEAVEDAPDDAVYGRSNGDWVKVPDVAATMPANPAPNTLWFDATEGLLYLWFDNGTNKQWIAVTPTGEAGPQGPPGVPGPKVQTSPTPPVGAEPNTLWWDSTGGALYFLFDDGAQQKWISVSLVGPPGKDFPDVPADGAYLRKNGAWIPMTSASAALMADITVNVINQWFDGPNVNIGNQGTWFISGGITINTAGAGQSWSGRLFDGTTTIADGRAYGNAANWGYTISLSGIITNPTGPIRISARNNAAANGAIQAGLVAAGLTRATFINAVRIG